MLMLYNFIADTTATDLSSQQINTGSTRLSWNIPIEAQPCVTYYTVNITGSGVMDTTETSVTVSVGGGISVNTPYTYTIISNPGGRQSGPGNFIIINNRECTLELSNTVTTVCQKIILYVLNIFVLALRQGGVFVSTS